LRGHDRRETNQPKRQTRAKTIAGLTKMQAAIGTVPIGLGLRAAAPLGQFTLGRVDEAFTGKRELSALSCYSSHGMRHLGLSRFLQKRQPILEA
jgi:hypothetical protein